MIRVVVFLVLTALFVYYVATWLADLPGTVPITWLGYRADPPMGFFVAAVAAAAVLLWSLLHGVVRAPRRLRAAVATRRRAAGHRAIMRGLMAIGAGDAGAARRFAVRARDLVPGDPLLLMLQAQTAQLCGEAATASEAFHAMANRSDTRLFGLHGLFIEAQRQGNLVAARGYAEAAAASSPSLRWAGQAALEFRCRDGDWPGALEALERNRRSGLVATDAWRRQRAVLLTAQALALKGSNREAAGDMAEEAAKLCPGLVPATALAGRLMADAGDVRKAARILEAGWRHSPHPDIASAYADLVAGAPARDRLARIHNLARIAPNHPESALALAEAAFDAREFTTARDSLAPLLNSPTRRAAMLMARIEAAENGDTGRSREWMARAIHAAQDPAWTADGVVAETWLPASPVTGRLDALEWRVPVADLTPRGPVIEQDAVAIAAVPAVAKPVADVPPAGPRRTLNGGAADTVTVRLPDDPGPDDPEPGRKRVPKRGWQRFPRWLAKGASILGGPP